MTDDNLTKQNVERKFTGRHMLIVMVSFFGVILTANLSMLYFANKSWTGLVVKNGYIASQSFNKKTSNSTGIREPRLDWEIKY